MVRVNRMVTFLSLAGVKRVLPELKSRHYCVLLSSSLAPLLLWWRGNSAGMYSYKYSLLLTPGHSATRISRANLNHSFGGKPLAAST